MHKDSKPDIPGDKNMCGLQIKIIENDNGDRNDEKVRIEENNILR